MDWLTLHYEYCFHLALFLGRSAAVDGRVACRRQFLPDSGRRELAHTLMGKELRECMRSRMKHVAEHWNEVLRVDAASVTLQERCFTVLKSMCFTSHG